MTRRSSRADDPRNDPDYRPPFRPWQRVLSCDRCTEPGMYTVIARHEPDDGYDGMGDVLNGWYGDRPDLGAAITCRSHITQTIDELSATTGAVVLYPLREKWGNWWRRNWWKLVRR